MARWIDVGRIGFQVFMIALAAVGAPLVGHAADFGPKLETILPPLAARNSEGVAMDLAAMSGPRGAVLVFFRSVRWCPYCQRQLIELETIAAQTEALGYPLVGISYDAVEALANFHAKRALTFRLMSDEGSHVIDALGLRDPQYTPDQQAFGVPRPIILVVDRAGRVQARFAEDDYKSRPKPDQILAALRALQG